MNQVLVFVVIKGLAELLCDTEFSRVPSDITVQDLPPVMRDHEEAVQAAEGDCWDSEKVHCSYGFPVMSRKACQRLAGSGFSELSAPSVKQFAQRYQIRVLAILHGCAERPKSDSRPPCNSLSAHNDLDDGKANSSRARSRRDANEQQFPALRLPGLASISAPAVGQEPEQPINASKSGFWLPALQSQELSRLCR